MSETDTLEAAWDRARRYVDFSQQPIWNTPRLEPLPPGGYISDASNAPVPFKHWQFRMREAYDQDTGQPLNRVVFGKLSDEDEWRPVWELPDYVRVGEWV